MLNQCNFIGNIGRIETKTTAAGKVCSFSIAVSSKNKDKDNTLWMNVSAWQKLAETCEQYLSKGKKVYVSGRLTSRTYDNKEGLKVTAYEIVASQVIFLSPREDGASEISEPVVTEDFAF
jgi:single-strand DNA-binding protein